MCDRGVKSEQSSFVEKHRDGRCRDNFGHRSQIEDGFGVDLSGAFVVGEMPKSLRGDQRSAMRDGKRSAGKGALLDSTANDGKSPDKLPFLIVEGSRWSEELL